MAKALKTGDRVAWRSSGGERAGRVECKVTSPGKIKGREIAASSGSHGRLLRPQGGPFEPEVQDPQGADQRA
jgi:hypothetical protein